VRSLKTICAGAGILVLASSALAQTGRIIDHPDWVDAGDPGKFGNLFPAKAKAADLATGRVVLDCIADAGGGMTNCRVVSEDPAGMDFGAAALKLATTMAIAPKGQDGQAVAGAHVDFAVRINDPGAAQKVSSDKPVRMIKDPVWLRQPEPYAFMNALPKQVRRLMPSVRLIVNCTVGSDGRLEDCSILEETPPGLGFGQAALKTLQAYRMAPTTRSGEPTAGGVMSFNFSQLRILATTDQYGGVLNQDLKTFVTRPVWASAPTRADVEAARSQANDPPLSERLVFNCDVARDGSLKACESFDANPSTALRAAAPLLAKFRLDMSGRKNASAHDLYVEPTILWSRAASSGPLVLASPQWKRGPDDDAIRAAFPPKAVGVSSHGQVGLVCAADAAGVMTGCRVIAETPAGLGFGEAALELSHQMAVNLWTEDGRPVEGAQVSFAITFDRSGPPKQSDSGPRTR
jgi:TonB family protein